MKYLTIIIFLMNSNLVAAQFVGTPYILKKIPDISLLEVTPIYATSTASTNFSCTLKGKFINFGTLPLLEFGFYYGKNFSTATKVVVNKDSIDVDNNFSFTISSSSLTYEVSLPTYYVWAYAKNSAGSVIDSTALTGSLNFFQIVPTIKSTTTQLWMDRNLGALTRTAGGYFYKWGQNVSGTGQGYSSNNNSWQLVNGINNPCPTGFHVPSSTEFDSEFQASNYNPSYLGIVRDGWWNGSNFEFTSNGTAGFWTSTVATGNTTSANFVRSLNNSGFSIAGISRNYAFHVRCIKN